jgi:short-subunit dehydrogenase
VPQETALITGASSGIGLELAKLFAADGARLILVARSVDKLEQIAAELRARQGADVRVLGKDLSVPGAARELFSEATADGTQIDALVNNAGFGKLARFHEIDVEDYVRMLELNVVALTELTRLCLPGMLERRRGCILNLGSTASFQPGPHAAVYYATKAYVRFLSEALSEELSGTGVTATCLCPGPTETGFGEVSSMQHTLLFRHAMRVEPVARAGYRAMRRGRTTIVTGAGNKLLALSSKFMPGAVVRKVVKAIQPVK